MNKMITITVACSLSLCFACSAFAAGPVNKNIAKQKAGNTITNGSPSSSSGSSAASSSGVTSSISNGVTSSVTSNPVSGSSSGASSDPYQGQDTNISIKQDAPAIAPAILAPGLTAGAVTCLGSKSGGVSVGVVGASVGGTLGTTIESERCNARADAASLVGLGEPAVAKARLCQVEAIAQAYADAGKPCPVKITKVEAVAPTNFGERQVEVQK
jgi:hypothetical protein